jgi:L-asparaginase
MAGSPRVAVIFTGGTISMTVDPVAGGAVPSLAGADLLALAPGVGSIADVIAVDRGRTPASHFSFADALAIGASIEDALVDPAMAGVVVVQGTDTLEETAFAWDLLHEDPRPVVVTGAMRTADERAWDGPANLRDAVAAAADPELRGAGVVVVMAGSVHPADDVVKGHASALDAFRSPNAGPLGTVLDGRLVSLRARGRRRLLGRPAAPPPGPVDLVTAALDTGGRPIDLAVAAGTRGIVVAATGAGNTHPDLLRAAEVAMSAGIPVVLASRTGAGRVAPTYAFPGGGARWARAGAIPAGTLSPVKARVALALGLGAELDRAALAALLADPQPA